MPPVRPGRNLKELPKFRDGLGYLYVEHAVIEQEAKGIALYDEQGVTLVPVAALAVLLLGPGTRITHAAVRAVADNGCTILWVGEDSGRFYASGTGETRSASRLLRQARAWAEPVAHTTVVKRLYRLRFPTPPPDDATVAQLRGLEGARVRNQYALWSRQTGVPWQGRNYDRGQWGAADPVNRALSAGAAFLYGLSHAAIISAGYCCSFSLKEDQGFSLKRFHLPEGSSPSLQMPWSEGGGDDLGGGMDHDSHPTCARALDQRDLSPTASFS